MKKSTILEVCQLDRGKPEKIPMSERYFKRLAIADEIYKKFKENIKNYPDTVKLFNELEEAANLASAVETDDYFLEGFRIGLLIGVEAHEPYDPKSDYTLK